MALQTVINAYNLKYEILHKRMLIDISHQRQQELSETRQAEACYWICVDHWNKLKEVTGEFNDEAAEINFFRNTKPKFTCYIEYFTLLSEALLFIPEDKGETVFYWEEHSSRFARFCKRHEKFIRYYENGSHYLDCIYFLRKATGLEQTVLAAIYDMDIRFRTSHDPLIRSYLANKMFNKYVKRKIASIKNSLYAGTVSSPFFYKHVQ